MVEADIHPPNALVGDPPKLNIITPYRASHAGSRSRRGLRSSGRLRDDFGAMRSGGAVGPRGCPKPVERF
jgi:hypothetical protein